MAAFTICVAAAGIKAPTVVKLASFDANLAAHDHKTVVQLQTHVHRVVLLYPFVCKQDVTVGRRHRGKRTRAALWLMVSGRIDANHMPGSTYWERRILEGLMR